MTARTSKTHPIAPEHPEDELHTGHDDKYWLVHKFGGTSVANGDCFRKVAAIIEKHAAPPSEGRPQMSIAAVVSAMGGKPKTTDLLLQTVALASERKDVESTLQFITEKHETYLLDLFPDNKLECNRLLEIIKQDLRDIEEVLKTVALMKWQASRTSELISGYGELWSSQIFTSLLRQRQAAKVEQQGVGAPTHEFVYLDARRLIIVDEEATQNGAIDWDSSERCRYNPATRWI
jgi:aspartokinase/homoserine dehydrogenase 1